MTGALYAQSMFLPNTLNSSGCMQIQMELKMSPSFQERNTALTSFGTPHDSLSPVLPAFMNIFAPGISRGWTHICSSAALLLFWVSEGETLTDLNIVVDELSILLLEVLHNVAILL